MKDDKTMHRATDNLQKTEYGKTWVVSEDESISQALGEILRATIEEEKIANNHGILFYIANQTKPIVITDVDIIRVGRSDGSTTELALDLSPFHGAELGVSRYHAEISYTDKTYFIKDMGSTNGTWVNNVKIEPYRQTAVHDADQLRFGHFTLLIKFSE